MSLKIIVTAAVLSLGLTSVQAYAEAEGTGDPFPFRAPPMVSTGYPFVVDTGSAAYPVLTGEVTQPADLTEMAPASGGEAPVQSLVSLPRGFYEGTPALAQLQFQKRYAEEVRRRELANR